MEATASSVAHQPYIEWINETWHCTKNEVSH